MWPCRYQRGHQNAVETYTAVSILYLLSGLKFPLVSAGLMILWCYGRYQYQTNYATGKPDARYAKGAFVFQLATMAFLVNAIWLGVDLVALA